MTQRAWIVVLALCTVCGVSCAGETEGNLLENGAFETGGRGWHATARPRYYNVVQGEGRDGSAALRYKKPEATAESANAHYDQVVEVKPGTLYLAEVYFRSPDGLRPTLRIANMEWDTLSYGKADAGSGWHRVRVLFRTGDESKVRFQIFGGATSGMRGTEVGTSYCDLAQLVSIAGARATDLMSTTVAIDAQSVVGKVSPLFFGANTLFMIDDDRSLADGEVARRLREMPCRLLRYPGGEMADNYLWKEHRLDNPDKWPSKQGPQTTDTDEFMELCREVGAEPIFVVNLDSGLVSGDMEAAARYAAKWVDYCNNDKNYDVEYWEIGNETYLKGDRSGPVTAEQYASAVRKFAQAMKKADPTIKIGAVGPRGVQHTGADVPGEEPQPWWPTLARQAGESFDFAVIHWYVGGSHIDLDSFPTVDLHVGQQVKALRRFLEGELEREIPIALTEWNVNKRVELRGMAAGVMLGELIGRFLEGGVEMATFWPMRFPHGRHRFRALLESDGNDPRTMYRVMHLFAGSLGDRLVSTDSEAVDLYALASLGEEDRRLTLFLVNKPIVQKVRRVSIRLSHFRAETAEVRLLHAEAPQRGTASLESKEVSHKDGKFSLRMPPFSIALVEFERR